MFSKSGIWAQNHREQHLKESKEYYWANREKILDKLQFKWANNEDYRIEKKKVHLEYYYEHRDDLCSRMRDRYHIMKLRKILSYIC